MDSEEKNMLNQVWFQNRMEVDKQILLLSSLGIGALITFDPKASAMICFWLLALSFFLITILFVLIIYWKNAVYLKYAIEENEKKEDEEGKLLSVFSIVAYSSFFIAVASTTYFIIKSKIGG